MFNMAVVGHSLVPVSINVSELIGVNMGFYQYPGATIEVLGYKLIQCEFFDNSFDFIILCIGGNDLAGHDVDPVFDKLRKFVSKDHAVTSNLSVCTVEYRNYPEGNMFNVDPLQYKSKVARINRKIKRFVPKEGSIFVDMGRTAFTLKRINDGVHFNAYGRLKFHNLIVKIVKAAYRQEN